MKPLKDLCLPYKANISCIFREPEVIIPSGDTKIKEKDKLVVVCKREDLGGLVEYFKEKVENDD